jgi:hypothetical protein
MTRSFLTGSLASIAVASAITLAAPAADAAERGCGQPAVDAVYSSVVHDPVFRTRPALTHSEWLWQHDVADYSYEFTSLVSAAGVETDWTRQVAGPTEYLFTRTVLDSPAVPAVPGAPAVGHFDTVVTTPAVTVTEWEYQHQVTGNLRWESEDWGAQNGQGNGWVRTGETRQTEVTPAVTSQVWVIDVPATPGTPAVPATTHPESVWALDSPGADWTGPADSRAGASSTEDLTTAGEAPAGDGWSLAATRIIPAVTDTVWALTAPVGYDPTGASKVLGSHTEQADSASATAPGDGWTQVAGSETQVVDVPATQELLTDGYTEQVLVSPALPATGACVEPPSEDPATETPATETPAQAAPAASPVATVLPSTGNGVPPWMAPTGLAAMLAGIAVIRLSRRPAVR